MSGNLTDGAETLEPGWKENPAPNQVHTVTKLRGADPPQKPSFYPEGGMKRID